MSSPTVTQANLPPKREGKPLRRVQPPLKNTRLTNLIYILVILSTLLTAFYSYRMLQWKSEVGGWWNLALGKQPPAAQATPVDTGSNSRRRDTTDGGGVEDKINALAEALGMPPQDLAKAIAVAVREYVPPASLSSIKQRETGKPAVDELLRGNGEGKTVEADEPESTGIVGGVFRNMDSFVGASIALGPNGLRGLEEMGALNAISDEIAFRSNHGFPMVYKHWKTGNVLVKDEHSPFVTEQRHHTARYFRPHLQQAIADTIPGDTIHLGKRLLSIDVSWFPEDEQQPASEGVLLTFADGSEHVADLVVGADGVHSTLRSLFLPDYNLEPTGQMALRAVFDEVHIHDLISRNPEIKNSVHVVGPDRNFFSSMLGQGKFTVVGLGYHSVEEEEEEGENTAWKGKKWDDVVDVESFRNEQDWNPWITDLLDRIPPNSLRVHPGWASNQVPPPIHAGRIVLLGDAFHPHGGAFAAGGSLAIDDSIALFLALQHVQQSSTPSTSSSSSSDVPSNSRSIEVSARRRLSASELSHALDLYASTRLPHASRVFGVVERMRENVAKPGRLWDEEKIQEWARDKKEVVWLHEHDVHRAFVDALNSEYIS
ncbi:hypothetical protein HHX47_DHR1000902 [Lentinula edodes]|nr:hypothetical protein HHX47_DHR1000902 [Lentinula edodes]